MTGSGRRGPRPPAAGTRQFGDRDLGDGVPRGSIAGTQPEPSTSATSCRATPVRSARATAAGRRVPQGRRAGRRSRPPSLGPRPVAGEIGHLGDQRSAARHTISTMAAPLEPLALAADFPDASRDDWRSLVRGVLAKSGLAADADPEAALTSTTYDGIAIRPLYTAADAPPTRRPARPPALRARRHRGRRCGRGLGRPAAARRPRSAARTREAVLDDLTNGASSIWLALGDGGLPVADLGPALDGVYLDLAPIALDAGASTAGRGAALLDARGRPRVAAGELSGIVRRGPDRAACAHRSRRGPRRCSARWPTMAADSPQLRVATVDATVYHDAGGSDADELAIAPPSASRTCGRSPSAGSASTRALGLIEFRYAVTAEQFPSIAKLRAARRIWGRIARAVRRVGADRGQYQHAVTSAAMLTQRDPWVNMLRTTIACFAAAVGGADAITVLPFDNRDRPAGRLRPPHRPQHPVGAARRVQPRAGHRRRPAAPGYVESLTDRTRRGGVAEVHRDRAGRRRPRGAGRRHDRRAARRHACRSRRRHRAPPRADHRRQRVRADHRGAGRPRPPLPHRAGGGPLHRVRYAEDFEALRDRDRCRRARARRCSSPRSARTPRTAAARASRRTCSRPPASQPVTGSGDVDEIVDAFARERRDGRVPVLVGQGLRRAGRAGRRGAQAGRRDARLAGRQGHVRGRRRQRVRRLRRARRR